MFARGAAWYALRLQDLCPGRYRSGLLYARRMFARVQHYIPYARRNFAWGLMFMYGCFITLTGSLPGVLQVMAALRPQDVCPGCSNANIITPAGILPGWLLYARRIFVWGAAGDDCFTPAGFLPGVQRCICYARRNFARGLMFMCGCITPAGCLPGALHVMAALRPQDVCPGCSMVCFTPAGSLPGALCICMAALRPQDFCPGCSMYGLLCARRIFPGVQRVT